MRIIDADAFGKILDKLKQKEEYYADQFDKKAAIRAECLKEVIEKLNKAPTIEAKPVVHAHWVNYNDMFPRQYSNCYGFALSFDTDNYKKEIESDFCPHCGAQMDEPFPQAHENGVKIPVISMEDVPKIMEELPSVEENPILKAVKEMEK